MILTRETMEQRTKYLMSVDGQATCDIGFILDYQETIDAAEARLSRYETAMREALAKLDTPLGKWKSIKDLYSAACHRSCDGAQLLRAALSDQPAEDCNHLTLIGGAPYCCTLQKGHAQGHTYEKAPAAPAEEPAESKLETLLRTRHDLRQEHEKLFTHSWAICTDEQKSYYATCKDLSRVDAAILDAQPSTPEPKGEI